MLKSLTEIFRPRPVAISPLAAELLALVEPGVYDASGELSKRFGAVFEGCIEAGLIRDDSSWHDDDLYVLTLRGKASLAHFVA
jgi:hypothetical protein